MRNLVMTTWLALFFFGVTATGHAEKPEPFPAGSVKFVKHRVGTYRGEACGVGDWATDISGGRSTAPGTRSASTRTTKTTSPSTRPASTRTTAPSIPR